MNLRDIFEQLSYGELSNLGLGNYLADEPESLPEAKDYARIMAHVNLALKALYTRFFLASRDVIIQQYDHIQVYTLDRLWARTNKLSDKHPRYIVDSVYEPFDDDVLKIEQVFDEDGRGLFLNDVTEPWSLFTPSYNQLQIPYPMWCNHLLVHYRASHPTLKYEKGMDPAKIQVQLPEAMLEPLLFYVASRVLTTLNVDNNASGNNWLQKYEQSCVRLEKLGLQVTPNTGNERLDRAGWV